jgi:glutaredoxin
MAGRPGGLRACFADAVRAVLSSWRHVALLLVGCLWAVSAAAAGAQAAASPPAASAPTLEVFVRDGCPHCDEAKRFLAELARERPDLRIVWRPVDLDPEAARELSERSRLAGMWPPGVPTFVVGDTMMVGFGDARSSGPELRALLDRQPLQDRAGEIRTPWGAASVARLGLPLFTLVLGLIDGVNPCAMWVLMFLLSLLVRMQDRRRMALIAGTFVVVSGAAYYAFMAAWLNLFLAVGFGTAVRVSLALLALTVGALNLKDFVAPGHGPTLGIPASARPGLVARMERLRHWRGGLPAMLLGVVALAGMVNLVELLCTAGLPAVYTAVLSQQGLSDAAYYAYLALYIVGYMADDSVMVAAAVWALSSAKLGARGARALKLVSAGIMLALGFLLLFAPQWLF